MRRLWPWLRLLGAVGILVALGWRLGADAFAAGLRAVDGRSVVAALGLGLLTTVCAAWRWRVIAHGLGLPLTLRAAVADYYRASLLNAVLPAGVLGDVHRAVSHGRRSGDVGRGVRAVLFERFAGQVVLVALALGLAGSALVDVPGVPVAVLVAVLVVGAVGAAVGVACSARVRGALRTTWADARAGLVNRRALPEVVALSAVAVAGHVALFVVAARAAGVEASTGRLVPLAVLALLVMAVPLNVGGFGPREAFLAVAFGTAGLGAAQGLTTGVVYGVLALVGSLPGVLTLVRRRPGRAGSEQVEVRPERPDERREHVPALLG
ncbi:lysylphosphatidylglycerol synthase transmembrane domain-containing protein [Saccharothrix hoggarensis]|uniref:Lysylphosphatidylglycerol synthase transmembrane domain-containing protein n=1 Tax=Saccharothrix hoggarensis TaxID=913853 RepID=A0ABW3QXM1_9PSEU